MLSYSEHFHDYLKLHERETEFTDDLHAIWSKTENALREVITTTPVRCTYGDDWIEELEKTRPNLKEIFNKCRQAQQKEERLFPDQASQNLIDFTYPADLFRIILAKGMWDLSIFSQFSVNIRVTGTSAVSFLRNVEPLWDTIAKTSSDLISIRYLTHIVMKFWEYCLP